MLDNSAKVSKAANRDVPEKAPKPRQDCSDVLHISVFFDGTGNNQEQDISKKKWSNVARLYRAAQLAAQNDTSGTLYPIYIAGVGTKFNGRAADWISATSAWIEDGFPGAGSGAGGSRRIDHASDMVNEGLREALIARANMLGGEVAAYAAKNSAKSFDELSASLSRHRLIKIINLSIFGFSRGAALARAFSNRVIKRCKRDGDELLYHGYPLRINFMGIFDTVASFGVPAQNARTPFTERELIVPRLVERCMHLVAAHELRFSFPVDLIRKDGRLADGWIEKVYPGVHSDVGGGYEPIEQNVENNYARIPMRAMMRESRHCGVRLLGYDEIKSRASANFKERFECLPETEKLYKAYMAALPPAGNTVEEQMVGHLKLYYSVNGTMHRKGIKSAGDRSRSANKIKYIFGSKGMAFEVRLYRALLKTGKWLRLSERNVRGFAQYVEIKDWQLAAWDRDATQNAVDFVSRYVHDSKVDFMGNIEPFTYFRPRGVDESSVSVWSEGGNWIRYKVQAIGSAARSIAEAGKEKVTSVAEGAVAVAKHTAEVAQERANEASEYAASKVDEASDFATRKGNEAVDFANRKVDQASDFVARKANDTAEASTRAYEAAAKSSRKTVETATRTANEMQRDAERLYENGVRWTHAKIDKVRDFLD